MREPPFFCTDEPVSETFWILSSVFSVTVYSDSLCIRLCEH